ncbi:MAG: hypothetical protein HYU36_21455 [Planctomycetes bacterium]|nr:hypothetical protein [Planctomycetota bacterium]
MKALESSQWSVQFAAAASPWWMLLWIPLAAIAGCLLYRLQLRGTENWHGVGLVTLRLALLVLLIFLAFRPSLIARRILTYPGRILLVIDDSESMAARDTRMALEEALRLARHLEPGRRKPGELGHELAEVLFEVEALVRRFETFQRGADRREDRFWEQSGPQQDAILGRFQRLEELMASIPGLASEDRRRLEADVLDLRTGVQALFTGEKSPGKPVFENLCARLESLAERYLSMQAGADQAALAKGDPALRAAAEAIRIRTRLELISEKLGEARRQLPTLAPGQAFLLVSLMSGRASLLHETPEGPLPPIEGTTDIIGRLEALLEEKSDFPLTAILLFSDGRDLGGRQAATLVQALNRKQVPLYAAAAGSSKEPDDLGVLRAVAPPFTVLGTPARVRVQLKTVTDSSESAGLQILGPEGVAASAEVEAGGRDFHAPNLAFTPGQAGLLRYSARLAAAPGEAFPAQNNSADFVTHVRSNKVRVLLLDERPRWETRFALHVFQRLETIDLNAIIAVVQENGTVARGVRRGAWPENLPALESYDLVVMGDLLQNTLSPAEWDDLRRFVFEKGGTVCFLGNGRTDPLPPDSTLADALLPVRPRPAPSNPAAQARPLERLEHIRITDTGALHPVTCHLAAGLEPGREALSDRLRPDTQVLLLHADSGDPLVSCRFAGAGKTLFIDADPLWKLLHPSLLAAHAEMYVGLVAWAVQGGIQTPPAGKPTPALGLDRRILARGEPMQVWVSPPRSDAIVVAEAGGGVIAEAAAEAPRDQAAIARAVFKGLPARDVTFRLKGSPESVAGPVAVVRENPELHRVARDEKFLRALTASTGGEYREFAEMEKFFMQLQPKERVEKLEKTWRLWDSPAILALLFVLLTAEWVWRKFAGLV